MFYLYPKNTSIKYESGIMVLKRKRVSLKMKVDDEFLEQLANSPEMIDKMSKEERKEILE
jgi:hypothetical protein